MQSKCIIQRCKTPILCNGSVFKFPTQFLRRNSSGNLSLHLNDITSFGVILYNKRTSFERGLLYTFRSSNKQFNHRFLHFVVSLQSKFYTLAPTFVFDVNIYFSSWRLLTIHSSLSLLQAIHRQYLILALSLPLHRLSATLVLSTLISLKQSLYRPVTYRKTRPLHPCHFVKRSLELRILESVICAFSML